MEIKWLQKALSRGHHQHHRHSYWNPVLSAGGKELSMSNRSRKQDPWKWGLCDSVPSKYQTVLLIYPLPEMAKCLLLQTSKPVNGVAIQHPMGMSVGPCFLSGGKGTWLQKMADAGPDTLNFWVSVWIQGLRSSTPSYWCSLIAYSASIITLYIWSLVLRFSW